MLCLIWILVAKLCLALRKRTTTLIELLADAQLPGIQRRFNPATYNYASMLLVPIVVSVCYFLSFLILSLRSKQYLLSLLTFLEPMLLVVKQVNVRNHVKRSFRRIFLCTNFRVEPTTHVMK